MFKIQNVKNIENQNREDSDAHLIPGEGSVDFPGSVEGLDEIDFKEFVSVELETNYIMDPTKACRETLEALKEMFK